METLCNKCGLCCKLIPAIDNNIIRDNFQPIQSYFAELDINDALNINADYVNLVQNYFPNAVFYTCKYLSENNDCTNPHIPESCKTFPNSALALVHNECGYYGEVFIKNEALKQKIRKLKEEIIHYQAQIIANPKDKEGYQKIINSHQNYIKKFDSFGANNW